MSQAVPRGRELLRSVSIFAELDAPSAAELERLAQVREYDDEAVIASQEEPGDALFVLVKGRVKVVLYGDSGREIILNVFKSPGDFFGEMSLLDDEPRSATLVASEPSRLLVLSRADFRAHIQRHPKTALRVLTELSRRLRRADELISNLALLDVATRVAHIMIDLAKRDGEEVEEGILIRERPTQQDIASMIGTSRETVSRVLSDFQRAGLVEMRGREILLTRKFTVQNQGA